MAVKCNAERDEKIYLAWRGGMSQSEIAAAYCLSRGRVHQIVWRMCRKLDRPEWERRILWKRGWQS